ncbi:putative transposable element [Trichonephila clavipes]|nr:putative transposable element [Trichonephila clavipes]
MGWNQHRRTFGPAYHSKWHFDGPKDDNARPHRARLVENMLEAETIQRMEWPACSPDLNPIEHVWDILGRRIAARPRPPATVRDLEIALLEEWNSIPQAGGIIGPYFFKNDEGHKVTVNGDRYTAIITIFFIPELNIHDVQELWFQQDGASCDKDRATIDLLKYTLGDRLISRFGPVNWPPRSCGLTQLDYFLWGYVKSLVYVDKSQVLGHLEDKIRRVIADIRPQILEKFIENWTSRLDYIRASRGSHMPEIIFKL